MVFKLIASVQASNKTRSKTLEGAQDEFLKDKAHIVHHSVLMVLCAPKGA